MEFRVLSHNMEAFLLESGAVCAVGYIYIPALEVERPSGECHTLGRSYPSVCLPRGIYLHEVDFE